MIRAEMFGGRRDIKNQIVRYHWIGGWAVLTIGMVVAIIVFPRITYLQAPAVLDVGTFSALHAGTALPKGWEPLTFMMIKHTDYSLVKDNDIVVVKAVSEGSASGLTRQVQIDPAHHPRVRWRWKAETLPKGSDFTRKEGDDYGARVYVGFEYDSRKVGFFEMVKFEFINLVHGRYPPLNAIAYIWDIRAPVGTIVPNPHTNRVQMIVVERGVESLDQWVDEERNVYDDYRTAFGESPPGISDVAIMTDTDNTGDSATAYFGDISFSAVAEHDR